VEQSVEQLLTRQRPAVDVVEISLFLRELEVRRVAVSLLRQGAQGVILVFSLDMAQEMAQPTRR
jgi:hypothetical protein